MKTSEIITEIENTYHKYFPDSFIHVKYSNNLYRSISIRCFLAKNRMEVSNQIMDNDILHIVFSIENENGELPKGTNLESELENITLVNYYNTYTLKPVNPYMAYGSKKMNYRKTTGNPEKIIATFDKFCGKLRESLMDDLKNDRIHKDHAEIVARKLFI